MSGSPRNEMILASAGSGKTYTLVTRFIGLLGREVPPGRIAALTFTRKAAGEFVVQILLRLRQAAAAPAEADRLCREAGLPQMGCGQFQSLLEAFIGGFGTLQMGTIDQFFSRIVATHPFEVGLSRPHRILEEAEQARTRLRVMEAFFGETGEQDRERLIRLYRELTWGKEEKRVYGVFEERLEACHALFVESGTPDLWGHPSRIYRSMPWWSSGETVDKAGLAAEIQEAAGDLEKKQVREAVLKLVGAFATWQPGTDLGNGTLFERLLSQREAFLEGSAELAFGRSRETVGPPLTRLLYRLVQTVVREEILLKFLATQSLGKLLAAYDRHYAESVRESGLLVFADLPVLLARALASNPPALAVQDLLYRMDARTDHWLVDEFQDTSRIQWKVLAPFIEEAIQDPSGERSFFCVGDIKQSLYGWRGGDPRLFGEIRERYQGGDRGIRLSGLHTSWRSAPPVLELVNGVFGEGVSRTDLEAAVRERWSTAWEPHLPSPRTRHLPGYAAWGLVDPETGLEQAVAGLLGELDPLPRGLTCAVLVRSNDEVASMTQALRFAGLPASMEGVVPVVRDNLPGLWILAFLYALSRPGEAFPQAYFRLPGCAFTEAEAEHLRLSVRRELSGQAHAAAVGVLLENLSERLPQTPFLRLRARQILEAAAAIERSGSGSLEDFIARLEATTLAQSAQPGQVQVMTVHKAKGLDFDLVVAAGFGRDALIGHNRSLLHVQRGTDGEIQWISQLPRQEIQVGDAALQAARLSFEEERTFEALCVLYVAMTRARQGLYCLAERSGKTVKRVTWEDLFRTAFPEPAAREAVAGICWQAERGEADWIDRSGAPVDAREAPCAPAPLRPFPPFKPALQLGEPPSQSAHASAFERRPLREPAGMQYGTRVHDFLAGIEWLDFGDNKALEALCQRAGDGLQGPLQRFFSSSPAREVFQRPKAACLVWREKPYAIREGTHLTQGIIDRVHLFTDADGQYERAIIYDFKTDALDPERPANEQLEERYALQVERYADALALLTGLRREAIRCCLVPV